MKNVLQIAQEAKNASYRLASLSEAIKNKALDEIVKNLEANKKEIFEANAQDLNEAKTLVEKGEITKATFGRLKLDENKLRDMIQGIRDVKKLEDPVNKRLWAMELDNGLDLYKVSCPIGVIGVIFEARPDVIAQISSLAIKSANAVILKGGKEASHTNLIITKLIQDALDKVEEFPKNVINQVFSREDVAEMLSCEKYIDLIIPRGGNALVKFIKNNTKIPVLGHADGICHIYVDKSADFNVATDICVDSKIQYPSACNAVETVLINKNIAQEFLPKLTEAYKKNGVLVKGCEKCLAIVPTLEPADEDDFKSEYGDLIISIKIVDDVLEAVSHINTYGSGHTDCIVAGDDKTAELFMDLVDSAGVYQNASTRFADGFRYGLGAEVGISTNKTHARGPVGLEGLTIYKYKLYGHGQIVADYASGAKKFSHRIIKEKI